MITQTDIIEVEITADMILEARADVEFLKTKIGKNTRAAYSDRDLIGSIAHQAVEVFFDEIEFYYSSTRKEQLKGGDTCDIVYENDRIDVKGTHGILDKYFYNKQFLVFSQQLEAEKMEEISHFIFVLVHPDLSRAWIFGEISVSDFRKVCETVTLQYDNKGIRGRHLHPMRNYVYRSGTR